MYASVYVGMNVWLYDWLWVFMMNIIFNVISSSSGRSKMPNHSFLNIMLMFISSDRMIFRLFLRELQHVGSFFLCFIFVLFFGISLYSTVETHKTVVAYSPTELNQHVIFLVLNRVLTYF